MGVFSKIYYGSKLVTRLENNVDTYTKAYIGSTCIFGSSSTITTTRTTISNITLSKSGTTVTNEPVQSTVTESTWNWAVRGDQLFKLTTFYLTTVNKTMSKKITTTTKYNSSQSTYSSNNTTMYYTTTSSYTGLL